MSSLAATDVIGRRHPNVLQFIGAVLQDGRTFLVTEFMAGGDLWSALAQDNTEFSWYKRWVAACPWLLLDNTCTSCMWLLRQLHQRVCMRGASQLSDAVWHPRLQALQWQPC